MGTLIREIILPGFGETLYMVIATLIIASIIGFILAVILVLTRNGGLAPNKTVNNALNVIINIIRSFPFIILMVSIIPLTRLIVGTSIGTTAAIVPLTISAAPFLARLFEASFLEIDPSVIEAAESFGATDSQIIFKVMLVEAVPSIVANLTLAFISILGATAVAGAIGAGGLGSIALIYGYQNFDDTIMYTTVVFLIILVMLIQFVGNRIYDAVK